MAAALLVSLLGFAVGLHGFFQLDALQVALGAVTLFLGATVVPTVPVEILEERRRLKAHLARNKRLARRARRTSKAAAVRRKHRDAGMARRARHAARAIARSGKVLA